MTTTLFKVNKNQLPATPYLPKVIEVTGGWVSFVNDTNATTVEKFVMDSFDGDDNIMLSLLEPQALKRAEFTTDEDGMSYMSVCTESNEALRFAAENGYLDEQNTVALVAMWICGVNGITDPRLQSATVAKLASLNYTFKAGLTGAYLVRGI